MKLQILFLITTSLFIGACSNGQNADGLHTDLSPKEFQQHLNDSSDVTLLDVRTPGEFSNGHLPNAVNVDWNGDTFDATTATLDKAKPVYVYCLSGSRSAAAADRLRSQGFKNVYELAGGITSWRAAGLKETTPDGASASTDMDERQYNSLLNTDKLVLVDFYAEWCVPCKKMKPYLDKMTVELKDRVTIIRIDADENPELLKRLNIEVLPTLLLYKDKQLVWNHSGYIEEKDLKTHLQ